VDTPTPGVPTILPSSGDVIVNVAVIRRVNYSLLHNEQSLFEFFTIHNATNRPIEGIQVEVVLYAGSDSYPYRRLLRVDPPFIDLKDKIRVPLTSSLLRGVGEPVQSVVYISVKHGQQSLYEDTVAVSLVPTDEWSIGDQEGAWLPSFVFPRDPAVNEIRSAALAPLRVLRKKADAGFDGYQAISHERKDPYEFVDMQVEAIWSALSFQYGLSYIGAPPTYAPQSQRLRSPSAIVASRSGTCIDLALLLASCLEYIELYPVIVLYDGHATVGYWRAPELHQNFQVVAPPPSGEAAGNAEPSSVVVGATATGGGVPVDAAQRAARAAAPQTTPDGPPADRSGQVPPPAVDQLGWVFRRRSKAGDPVLHDLEKRVELGDLAILETTCLTRHLGFDDALDEGKASLREREFRALVEVTSARRHNVLPLPIER
jgi:hypothetical protein